MTSPEQYIRRSLEVLPRAPRDEHNSLFQRIEHFAFRKKWPDDLCGAAFMDSIQFEDMLRAARRMQFEVEELSTR